jgi:hypothetical protein
MAEEKQLQISTEKSLAKKLFYVKTDVKALCFSLYLTECKKRHAIAFFAWRKKFANSSLMKLQDVI